MDGRVARASFLLAISAGGALFLGACGGEDDLPERTGDPEGTEIVPGEDGPVD